MLSQPNKVDKILVAHCQWPGARHRLKLFLANPVQPKGFCLEFLLDWSYGQHVVNQASTMQIHFASKCTGLLWRLNNKLHFIQEAG